MFFMRSAVILFLSLFIWGLKGTCQEIITVAEDSYIRGGQYRALNYGNEDRIVVKSAPSDFPEFTRRGYLKFDLSDLGEHRIGQAILRLKAEESASLFISASLVSDDWEEENLTWDNAPPSLGIIDSAGMEQADRSYSIDITSAFFKEAFGDGTLSVMLEDQGIQDLLVELMSRESGEDAPEIIFTPSQDTLVEAPELTYAHLQGADHIELSWKDRSHNETGFELERSINDGPFIPLDILLFNTTGYLDTVSIGNKYTYRIRALNPVKNSDFSEEKGVDLSAENVPGPVTEFYGRAEQPGSIALYWDYAEDAEGFILSREAETGFIILDSLEYDDTTYTDYGRSPLSPYRYYLEAYNFRGRSLPSDTLEVTTLDRRTYYFDASSGDDSHPFNTKSTPWRTLYRLNEMTFGPGDSILLKSGETWMGRVIVKGSGNSGYPITFSSYGPGPRPVINGNGFNGPVMTLQNVSHWNLSNLELTNPSAAQGDRLGILIVSTGDNQEHIHLDNLYIHDIFGRYSFQMIGKNTGGIGIIADGEARFDDILIQQCTIEDIVRVGIFTNGNTGTRDDRPFTNLIIRNNTVSRCAGDGMIIRYAHRPLIEQNLAVDNHNGPEELVEFGVAIWVRSTDEAVIQYNRVFNTRGSKDGQAFDADLDAYHTLVQYNYTRNNEGGFMLVYGSSRDAIVRYNISQNDGLKGKHLLDFPVWTSPRGSAIIHNNVFYIGEGIEAVLVDEALGTTKLYNNIVINEGGGELAVPSENQTARFSHNCLVGYTAQENSLNSTPVEGDPRMLLPGSGGDEFSSLEGYWITPGSPCIRAGIGFAAMEGNYWAEPAEKDIWDNPVNEEFPDVGAHQYSGPLGTTQPFSVLQKEISWQVAPNPFSEVFFVSMKLPGTLQVQINMFDMEGRRIDTLFDGVMVGGLNTLFCRSNRQTYSSNRSGIYLLQLSLPEISFMDSRMIIHH